MSTNQGTVLCGQEGNNWSGVTLEQTLVYPAMGSVSQWPDEGRCAPRRGQPTLF